MNSSIKYEDLGQFGYLYSPEQDKWHVSDVAIDFLYIGTNSIDFELPGTIGVIKDYSVSEDRDGYYPLYTLDHIDTISSKDTSFIICKDEDKIFTELLYLKNCIIILETDQYHGYRLSLIHI